MIKAAELRIGNLILRNPQLTNPATTLTATPVEVAFLSADEIGYFSPTIEHRSEPFEDDVLQTQTPHKPLEEFEPMPLTEDVLEKLTAKTFSLHEDLQLIIEHDGIYFVQAESRKKIVAVTSVHQLQNLYFGLTGHELEISW